MLITFIIIIVILIFFIVVINYTKPIKFCRNLSQKLTQNTPFQNGCYNETWGINDVGYLIDDFPAIESYNYPSYNFNLFNTDIPEFPHNFGNIINTN